MTKKPLIKRSGLIHYRNNFLIFRLAVAGTLVGIFALFGFLDKNTLAQTWSEPANVPPMGQVAGPVWAQNSSAQTGGLYLNGKARFDTTGSADAFCTSAKVCAVDNAAAYGLTGESGSGYGLYATSGSGVAVYGSSTSGYAGYFNGGNVVLAAGKIGVDNISPSALLTLGTAGTTAGTLSLAGATTGVVTIDTLPAAGTWSFTLPPNGGTAGQYLQTDGAGNATWQTVAAGSQTPWTSNINGGGYTLTNLGTNITAAAGLTIATTGANDLALNTGSGNITSTATTVTLGGSGKINGGAAAAGNLTFDSTSNATKGYTIINPTGGNVGIGNNAPAATLSLGTAATRAGTLSMAGVTSGTVTIDTLPAAGTWTLTLPANGGTANQFLQTDGAGNTIWAAAGGGGGNYVSATYDFSTTSSVAVSTTTYLSAVGGAVNATEANMRYTITRAGTLQNLYWSAASSTLTGSGNTITVIKNGVATTIVSTWNAGATSGNDTTHTVAVAAGDTISIKIVTVAGGTSIVAPRASLELLTSGGTGSLSTSGSPILNYVTKFTGTSPATISNSTIFDDGTNVGISNSSPSSSLTLGTAGIKAGILTMAGATSGTVIVQPPAAAGGWTMVLPGGAGTTGQCLQTTTAGTIATTSWGSCGSGSSQWTTSGSNIYYTTGSVGIGLTAAPGAPLQIDATTGYNLYLSHTAPSIRFGDNATIGSASGYGLLGLATAGNHFVVGSTAGDLVLSSGGGNLLFGTGTTNVAAGAVKMELLNNGNFGIGTATPGYLLQVKNGGAGFSFDATNQNIGTTIGTGGGIGLYAEAPASTTGAYEFIGGSGRGDASKNATVFYANNTEYMRIDGNYTGHTVGNVGIGTATPNNKIQVAGLINFDSSKNNTYLGTSTGASNSTGTSNVGVGTWALLSNSSGIDNTALGYNALVYNSSGTDNTAVGGDTLVNNTNGLGNTAVGSNSLYDNSTGYYNTAVGQESGTSIESGVVSSNNRCTYVGYQATASNFLTNCTAIGQGAFATASNQVVIGNDSVTQTLLKGNVGVGGRAPDYTFGVHTGTNQNFQVRPYAYDGTAGILLQAANDANTVGVPMQFGATAFAFRGGNVGIIGQALIGQNTNGTAIVDAYNGYAFFGNNNVTTTRIAIDGAGNASAPSFTPTSDARLKKNITPLDDSYGLNIISQLNPVSFNWKNQLLDPKMQLGFVAQDVQKLLPTLVNTGPEGMLTLNYNGLIAPIVKSIQEQQKEIDDLKQQIEELKAK